MFKALVSFCNTILNVRKGEILREDFTDEASKEDLLNANYIKEYDNSLEITENGIYDTDDYQVVDVQVAGLVPTGTLEISQNGTYDVTNYAGANVNIASSGIDTTKFKNIDSLYNQAFPSGTTVELGDLDFSGATSSQMVFYRCFGLKTVGNINLSSSTNAYNLFNTCRGLTSVGNIIGSSITSFASAFASCSALKTIGSLDLDSVTNVSDVYHMFNQCSALEDIYSITNIKVDISFAPCNNLSHDTLLRILNALVEDQSTSHTLTLGSTNIAKLTEEEKAIATNKNWTLA